MLQLAHKQLHVYHFALELVKEIYVITRTFPREEHYGLVSQLRRAAISVCSNLAEGSARSSRAEKCRFYEISRGSIVEIDTQIEISLLLEYLKKGQTEKLETLLESVFRMISRMISNLR